MGFTEEERERNKEKELVHLVKSKCRTEAQRKVFFTKTSSEPESFALLKICHINK